MSAYSKYEIRLLHCEYIITKMPVSSGLNNFRIVIVAQFSFIWL